MSAYEPAAPRAALGVAAVAMAAVTVFTLVVLPAKLDSGVDSQSAVTASVTTAPPAPAAAAQARADAANDFERKKQFALSGARPYGNGAPAARVAY